MTIPAPRIVTAAMDVYVRGLTVFMLVNACLLLSLSLFFYFRDLLL